MRSSIDERGNLLWVLSVGEFVDWYFNICWEDDFNYDVWGDRSLIGVFYCFFDLK